RALAHITSGGFLNLERIEGEQDGPVPVGYAIDFLPEPPPIFSLIQRLGGVPDEEMYRVFNMGIGFCLVLPESAVDAAARIAADPGPPCHRLGTVVPDPARQVLLRPRGLIGRDGAFHRG